MPAIAEPPKTETPKTESPKPGELASSVLESLMHGEKPIPASPSPEERAKAKADADKEAADAAAAEKAKADEAAAKAKPEPDKKAAAKAKEPKVEKVETPPPAPAAEPNYEKIAEAAARGTASAMKAGGKAVEPSPLDDLSDEEREMHEAFEQMEKDYPSQYKGKLASRYVESLRAADKWEADWQAKHPDLDDDSDEYKRDLAEFQAKNTVQYADIHFQKSLANMATDKKLEKERGKDDAKLKAMESKERLREEAPKIIASRATAAREYFDKMGEQFKDVLDANGNINHAEIKKLVEADPLNSIAMSTARNVEAFAAELYALTNSLVEFDDKNESHQFIAGFVSEKEAQMKFLPAAQQLNEQGQRFVTAEEYAAIPKEQRRFYWRYSQQDLSDIFAAEQAEIAKASIAAEEKRVEELATKRGFVKATPKTTDPNPPVTPPVQSAPAAPLAPSPSGASAPIQTLPNPNGNNNKKSPADTFAGSFLS